VDTQALLGTYAQDGFRLLNLDPNLLILYSPDNIKVALFNALNVTADTIQGVCSDWSFKKRRREYGKPREGYQRRNR
jgi:hypothetical protein